jgi:hypothetical protein
LPLNTFYASKFFGQTIPNSSEVNLAQVGQAAPPETRDFLPTFASTHAFIGPEVCGPSFLLTLFILLDPALDLRLQDVIAAGLPPWLGCFTAG